MILSSLSVNNFCGIARRTVNYDARINICVGPNESGKSTLVHAISHVLFTPTEIGRGRQQELVRSFASLDRRKQPEVIAEFIQEDIRYRVVKRWELIRGETEKYKGFLEVKELNTGSVVATQQDELNRLFLPLPAGIMQLISVQTQDQQDSFYVALQSERELGQVLEEKLRQRVFVPVSSFSVAQFKDLLNDKIDACYANWDKEQEGPAKGRGVSNPWKKNVGIILERYYAWKEAESHLYKVREVQKEHAQLQQRFSDKEKQCIQLHDRISAVIEQLKQVNRQLEYDRTTRELQELRDVRQKWPRYITILSKKKEELRTIKEDLRKIEELLPIAREKEKLPELLQRYKRMQDIQKKVIQFEEKCNAVYVPEKQTLDRLRVIEKSLERYQILYAHPETDGEQYDSFRLIIKGHTTTDIELQLGLQEKKHIEVSEHSEISFKGLTSFLLTSRDFDIRMEKGSRHLNEDQVLRDSLLCEKNEILQKFRMGSTKELEEQVHKFDTYKRQLEEEREKLSMEKVSLEQLKENIENLEKKNIEPLEVLLKTSGELEVGKRKIAEDIESLETTIRKYCEKFGSLDELNVLIDKKIMTEHNEDAKEPLISEDNRMSLDRQHQDLQDELDQNEKERDLLREDLNKVYFLWMNALGAYASEEDLARHMSFCEQAFYTARQEGEHLCVIRDTAHRLEEEAQRLIFEPFRENFTKRFSMLSNNRYKLAFNDIYSELSKDSYSIQSTHLSSGTKVVLALAARLATMDVLYPNGGFLVLDDPFAQLDTERRKLLANLLSHYAQSHQILLFSCWDDLPALFLEPHVVYFSDRL